VEAGFVRILSNPAFSAYAVTPKEALEALEITMRHPAHRFWPDDLGVSEALAGLKSRLYGHQQVTDAYLLGLAIHHKGKLATLDQRLAEILADRPTERHFVEHIR
jgi:predicted nucleic acid-binding protein